MKWWLPLVIALLCCALFVIVVVIVVLRRRQRKHALKTLDDPEEMIDEEKFVNQINSIPPNEIQTSAAFLKGKSLTQNVGENSNQSTKMVGFQGMPMSRQQFVEVMDVESGQTKEVVKMETLFERLHNHKTGIVEKRQRQIEIARGTSMNRSVYLTDGTHDIDTNTAKHQSQCQTQTAASSVAEHAGSANVNNENASGLNRATTVVREKEDQEDQRWQAPEQGEHDVMPSCDVEKVTVFRLGLVLWEMESGQIPFRETDGVNAGRQLKAGVKPQMSLVENKEMEELILKCLELKATDRIGLDDLISSLDSIPDDPAAAPQLFGS
ncbi:hypothetical protein BLNAU_24510 [Blattamonas nauphoetae]|uniref:Serine-threonine/tyrosine-protein kinase catalytic domain-containing protein n=1 Tax=Blattamonas nauphoetae TaxID=2049346 RepID=A0ABQ9WM78_9EUKA|nr:hypothetical protein BLNAU_24510 [Blattamonas nauphoetae]